MWNKLLLTTIFLSLATAQEKNKCGTYDGEKYPDPKSCYHYYQCSNGVPIRKTCSFGMVYNCFLKICTLKVFAPCCRYDPNPPPTYNGCLNLGIKVPNPFVCNKYFECSNWKIIEKTCPPGKKFDFLDMSCVDSNGCRCAPGTVIDNSTTTITTTTTSSGQSENCPYEGATYPDIYSCSKYYKCKNGSPILQSCRFGLVYNCVLRSCTFRAFTPCCKYDKNPGSNSTYCFGINIKVPNPFECDKYFTCKNFHIVEKTCPIGKKFDWIKMNCVDANGCHCAPSTTHQTTTLNPNTQESIWTEPQTTTMSYNPTIIILTTANYSLMTTTELYTTTNRIPSTYIIETTSTSSENPTTTSTQIPTTSSVITTSTSTSTECDKDGQTYPDTSSCNSYYRCYNGHFVKRTCPFGLVYNCFWKICTLRAFTPCCRYDNSSSSQNDNSCFSLNVKIPNPFQCDSYYQCIYNQIVEKHCPAGQNFDWIYLECVDSYGCHCAPGTNSNTSMVPVSTTTPKPRSPYCTYDGIKFGDKNSCRNYYQCVYGQPVKKTCPYGLVYNCFWRACTFKIFSPCCRYEPNQPPSDNSCLGFGIKVPNPFDCKKYFQCVNFKIEEKTCQSGTRYDWIKMNCIDANNCHCAPNTENNSSIVTTTSKPRSKNCPYDGITYPDTTTCRNYYQCIFGQPVKKTCPFGFVYNCFLKLCTLRAFAPCCKYDPTLPPYDDTCFGVNVKIPNPFECNKYFQCKGYKITEQTCSVGKKYDWLKMNCVDANGCHCAPGT